MILIKHYWELDPSKKNKLYPFPTKKDQELANKYLKNWK